jgi:predicted DNA-binding protein (MmcQ/YjbR family)
MAKPNAMWLKLREYALAKPESYEDYPWGERVVKVNKKIFVFLGDGEGRENHISMKLLASNEAALSVPGASPVGYGLGRSGWVTVPIGTKAAPLDVLIEWIDESYTLVAPKRLTAAPKQSAPAAKAKTIATKPKGRAAKSGTKAR